jgi:serine protease
MFEFKASHALAAGVFSVLAAGMPICAPAAQGFARPAAAALAMLSAPEEMSDRLIVKLRTPFVMARHPPMGSAHLASLSAVSGVELKNVKAISAHMHVLRLPGHLSMRLASETARRLATDPSIEYAAPDHRVHPQLAPGVPNDPAYAQQWYLNDPSVGINTPQAWDITTGSPGITVAILDTGFLPHFDLALDRIAAGYDFVSADPDGSFKTANDGDGPDPNPVDPGDWVSGFEAGRPPFFDCPDAQNSDWHGTVVTGIVGAASDNGTGIAGINWHSTLLPVRVLGKCGGNLSDILQGARWAAGLSVPGIPDNPTPAQILNFSLGGSGSCDIPSRDTINEILTSGVTRAFVTAAGNFDPSQSINSLNSPFASTNSPGNCAGMINVAALDRPGDLARYSKSGPEVTISAPGGNGSDPPIASENIISLGNDGPTTAQTNVLVTAAGTSLAAPQVAGVVSLMLSVNPGLTPPAITALLRATAFGFPSGSSCDSSRCGPGIVDAGAAVRAAAGALSPATGLLGFGQVNPGSVSPSQSATFVNNAPVTLTIVNPIVLGGSRPANFAITDDGCSGAALTPGQQCSIAVAYMPSSRGRHIAAATLNYFGAGAVTEASVSLMGDTPPAPAPPPAGDGGGGGGCSIALHQPGDPSLAALLVLALAGRAIRRRFRVPRHP